MSITRAANILARAATTTEALQAEGLSAAKILRLSTQANTLINKAISLLAPTEAAEPKVRRAKIVENEAAAEFSPKTLRLTKTAFIAGERTLPDGTKVTGAMRKAMFAKFGRAEVLAEKNGTEEAPAEKPAKVAKVAKAKLVAEEAPARKKAKASAPVKTAPVRKVKALTENDFASF